MHTQSRLIRNISAISALTLVLLSYSQTIAARSDNVFLGERLCTDDGELCIKASLDFFFKQRKLELNARVLKNTHAGTMRLCLEGFDRQNKRYHSCLKARLQGNYSEIVKATSSKIRNEERQINWRVDSFSYKE